MEPAVCDLVHAWLPRLRWVTLANRHQYQSRLRSRFVTGKDRAPSAGGLGDIELHAALETRSILAFGFAAQKPLAWGAHVTQLSHHRLYCRSRCQRAADEVLLKHLIEYPNLKARTRARAHDRLPLAVGGQRSEVSVEVLGAHRGSPGPLADFFDGSRLGGPVRREDELHLCRFLLGHRLDLIMQLSLGHKRIVPAASAEPAAPNSPSTRS